MNEHTVNYRDCSACGRHIAVRALDGRTYTHADYRVPPIRAGGRWRQPWCPGSMRRPEGPVPAW